MVEQRSINESWQINKNGHWELIGSIETIAFPNMHKRLPAQGAIRIERVGAVLSIGYYATFESPIDNLTACPGELIWTDQGKWQIEDESNGFKLKAISRKLKGKDLESFGQQIEICGSGGEIYKIPEEIAIVETIYEIPEEYTGPHYQKRLIFFRKENLQILKVEMEYKSREKDVGEFFYKTPRENSFEIWWQCQRRILNKRNVSFF